MEIRVTLDDIGLPPCREISFVMSDFAATGAEHGGVTPPAFAKWSRLLAALYGGTPCGARHRTTTASRPDRAADSNDNLAAQPPIRPLGALVCSRRAVSVEHLA